jgi:hypothetical protein
MPSPPPQAFDALAAWDRALAARPRDAGLMCGKASVLQSLARTAEAAALFAAADAAEPGHLQAGVGLAMIALETGDLAAAGGHAARLAALHGPQPPVAWLAGRVAMARGEPAAAEAHLAPLADDPALSPEQRADVLLLRGEALDALGRTAEAFASAVRGKSILQALNTARAASREGEVEKLRRLKAWFEAADPADWAAAPQGADDGPGPVFPDPVFLVGFPRSGTTLLEQLLAGHPDVSALEEAPTLAEPYAEYMTDSKGLARLAALSPEAAAAGRARYWRTVRELGGEPGRVFLDKAPAGTLYLPLVAKLFPRAKVLFAVRDPRDVVLSCLRHNFQMNAMTFCFTALDHAAACYDACMGLAEVYRRVLPLDLTEARHEALVADLPGELARLAAFLGLEVTPGMADIAATAARRTVRTPSARQVRAGLNTAGLGRWRAYAHELAPVMGALAPWVRRYGYAEA